MPKRKLPLDSSPMIFGNDGIPLAHNWPSPALVTATEFTDADGFCYRVRASVLRWKALSDAIFCHTVTTTTRNVLALLRNQFTKHHNSA
jgi:hypothetical protein